MLVEADGTVAERPWMGHGPHDTLENGSTYYALLLNENGSIARGTVVTIEVAGTRLEHVIVQ